MKIRKATTPICLQAKEALQEQKEKIKTSKDAELRMREQTFGVTAKSYITSVKKFHDAQDQYKETVRDTMRRMLDQVASDMSDEDKEKCIDEGRAQQVFQAIFMGTSTNNALANTYKDVSEQHTVRFVFVFVFFCILLSVLFLSVCLSLSLSSSGLMKKRTIKN